MIKHILFIIILVISSGLKAETASGKKANSGSSERYFDVVAKLKSREDSGENVICGYMKGSHPDSSEEETLKECQLLNSIGDPKAGARSNKLCMIDKIQCFNQSMGFFEMENIKFYIPQNESCKDTNPAEAFKNHSDFGSKVVFVEGH